MAPSTVIRAILMAFVLALAAPGAALAAPDEDEMTADEDFAQILDVQANDPERTQNSQIASVTQALNGTTAIEHDTYDQVLYTPAADYCNTQPGGARDSFDYTTAAGTATVRVTVNCLDDAPLAVSDSATVIEDSGTVDYDVLANDTDVDGGPKQITQIVQPQFGTASLVGGKIRYTPPADFCGGVNVGYTLNNSIFLAQKTFLSVEVDCRPDLPVANDDSFTVGFGSGTTFLSVLANDTDADNLFNGAANPEDIPIIAVTKPLNGTAAIVQGASVNTDQIAYTPNTGFCGTDSFLYRVFRDEVPLGTVTVTVPCPVAASGGPSGGAGGSTKPPAKASAKAGKVSVAGTALKVPVSCTRTASCPISMSLSITQNAKASKKKTVVIGKARVTLKPGQKRTITVKLNKAGKRALKKSRKLKAKLKIVLGGKTLTTRTVRFKVKRKR